MVLLVLSFFLVLIFFYNSRVFIYSLMVFFVVFDMLDGFYGDEKIFAAVRYLVPLVLIAFLMIRDNALKRSDFVFIVVVFYMLILLVYSGGDLMVSAKNVLAVTLTLLMIPLGKYLGTRVNFLEEFEWYNRFLLVILPVYIIIANILGIGESYSDAFTTGFLITSRMYIVPIVVFLAIHYLITYRNKNYLVKAVDISFIIINIGITIINTRRTALGMLAIALLVYGFLNRRILFKMMVMAVVFVGALIIGYPLYEKPLTAQLEKRERIQNIDTYEEEGRVLETLYIMDHHSRSQDLSQLFFGVKLFDTYDFGTRYFGRDRPIHSDLNMIFYSTGIVGVLLFGWLFAHYFLFHNESIIHENRNVYYPLLAMFLVVLFPGRFIGTMTYAPFLMLVLAAVKAWQPQVVHIIEDDHVLMPVPNS